MELKDNKYFKWYWSICDRAKDRVLEENIYIERHHIYPKSIYGENKDLVSLTAKEHYIVHLLLWQGFRFKYGTKDERTRKMAGAFCMMDFKSPDHFGKRYNSRLYSLLKIAYHERNLGKKRSKEYCKSVSGKNHYAYGTTLKEETKQKISESCRGKNAGEKNGMYGKKLSPETIIKITRRLFKPVFQYNLDGKFIKEYPSRSDASQENGFCSSIISSCCSGDRLTGYNFFWAFNRLNENEISDLVDKNKHKYDYQKNNLIKYKGIPIIQYDLDGNFIKEYASSSQASREINISRKGIINCCKNRTKSINNYIFKYKEEICTH